MARALGCEFGHAKRLGFQCRAYGVEQGRQCRIVRPLPSRPTRGPYPPQISEVGLNRRRQFRVRSCHRPVAALPTSATRYARFAHRPLCLLGLPAGLEL